MKIVNVTAEFAPIAKAGGMGEMVVGLARELTRLSEDVEIILPKYQFIPNASLPHLTQERQFTTLENGVEITNIVWSAVVEGCRLLLIEPRHPAGYFDRDRIYSFEDDIARFLYFSRAVYDYLSLRKQPIDILHLHDWHVAALAPLIATHNSVHAKGIVLSLHNSEYQGICTESDIAAIGLRPTQQLKHQGKINLLKGGIEYAHAIIPVSPTYAKEILNSPLGFGLEPIFLKNQSKIHGILNGIDQTLWNPATDPHLPFHYSIDQSVAAVQKAKKSIRETLIQKYNLSQTKGPWFGAITRLVPAKGIDLLENAIPHIQKIGGTFVLLGSSPIEAIQQRFEALQNTPNTLIQLTYDDALAHQLYASLDFLLVPSQTEPCGLTQMIGMRYGTIPIARATGGLADTVFDWENSSRPFAQRNGFLFQDYSLPSFQRTIDRAVTLWKKDHSSFETLLRHALSADHSWHTSADTYRRLFHRFLKSARNAA